MGISDIGMEPVLTTHDGAQKEKKELSSSVNVKYPNAQTNSPSVRQIEYDMHRGLPVPGRQGK